MIFPCPLCGQKLQAADDAAGKRCRCTRCKSLVAIPIAAQGPSHTKLVQPKPVQPRLVEPPRNVLAEELEGLIVERRQQARQRATAEAEQRTQAERQQRALRAKARAAERSANKPTGTPVFLTMVLASCGVMLLFCGGAVGLLYWKNSPPAMVLQAGGYQVTAYGSKTTNSRNDGTTDAKGTLSPTTGSEFWIATVQLPADTQASVGELKSRFAEAAETVEVVQRGGLEGIKCTGITAVEMGQFGNLRPEMEIFMVPNQLILLTYVPGSNKHAAGLQARALPIHRERRHDNPERFFKSLQPATGSPSVP